MHETKKHHNNVHAVNTGQTDQQSDCLLYTYLWQQIIANTTQVTFINSTMVDPLRTQSNSWELTSVDKDKLERTQLLIHKQ